MVKLQAGRKDQKEGEHPLPNKVHSNSLPTLMRSLQQLKCNKGEGPQRCASPD